MIVEDAGAAVPVLMDALRAADVEVDEVSEEHASFDDVFVQLDGVAVGNGGSFEGHRDFFVDFVKGIIRTSSFFFKEIWAAIRQPRLILQRAARPIPDPGGVRHRVQGADAELDTLLVLPNDRAPL